MPQGYLDGIWSMNFTLPASRAISNTVAAQPRLLPNRARASDYIWQWGQLLDHDLGLTAAEEVEVLRDADDPHRGDSSARGRRRGARSG